MASATKVMATTTALLRLVSGGALSLDDRVERWRREPVHAVVNDGNAYFSFGGVAGHAGLFSTLDDMLGLASAMAAAQEHEDLWRSDVVAEFLRPGPDAEQALGWRRYAIVLGDERLSLLGHPGFVGCAVGFVPERRIALAMCTNRLARGGVAAPTSAFWAQCIDAAACTIMDLAR